MRLNIVIKNNVSLYNIINTFIRVYGKDDAYLSGNPNFSIGMRMLGFIGMDSHCYYSDRHKNFELSDNKLNDLILNYQIIRHTNTQYFSEKVNYEKYENNEYYYNLTLNLSQTYQYLTKIFLVCTEISLIKNIIVNVGGLEFKFDQTKLLVHNIYKRQIFTHNCDNCNDTLHDQFIEIPLPLLENKTCLPLLSNFDINIVLEMKKENVANIEYITPFIMCSVIEADSEEKRNLYHMMSSDKNLLNYVANEIDLNSTNMIINEYNIIDYDKGKLNNYFRIVELSESFCNDDLEIDITSNFRPIKEIFIKNEKSNVNNIIEINVLFKNQNYVMTHDYYQMKTLQLSNYSKYNDSFDYIPFTCLPNCLQHTGEITCTDIQTKLKYLNNKKINNCVTYGNALIHFYYDTNDKKIKCEIVKMCALENFSKYLSMLQNKRYTNYKNKIVYEDK